MSLTTVCQKRCFALQNVLGYPNWSRHEFGGRAVALQCINFVHSLGDEAALNA